MPTNPTQVRRWGYHAEAIRKELEQVGQEIVNLTGEWRRTTNVYEQRAISYEIESLGERVHRLALQAKVGIE